MEKGKIVCPVKGATLIGSGAEVMGRISMVGNDPFWIGIVCDTSVPVGVGQPTLRVDALTVGGTAPMSQVIDILSRMRLLVGHGEEELRL